MSGCIIIVRSCAAHVRNGTLHLVSLETELRPRSATDKPHRNRFEKANKKRVASHQAVADEMSI